MTNDDSEGTKISVLDKHDLINLVKGEGVPYGGVPELARFTGCQWNDSWKWSEDRLRQMDDVDLLNLYIILKDRGGR